MNLCLPYQFSLETLLPTSNREEPEATHLTDCNPSREYLIFIKNNLLN